MVTVDDAPLPLRFDVLSDVDDRLVLRFDAFVDVEGVFDTDGDDGDDGDDVGGCDIDLSLVGLTSGADAAVDGGTLLSALLFVVVVVVVVVAATFSDRRGGAGRRRRPFVNVLRIKLLSPIVTVSMNVHKDTYYVRHLYVTTVPRFIWIATAPVARARALTPMAMTF